MPCLITFHTQPVARLVAYVETAVRGMKAYGLGITTDPIARTRQCHGFDELVILFETDSLKRINQVKGLLAKHNRKLTDSTGDKRTVPMSPSYCLYLVRAFSS